MPSVAAGAAPEEAAWLDPVVEPAWPDPAAAWPDPAAAEWLDPAAEEWPDRGG